MRNSQEEDEFFVERILDRRRNDETGEYEYFIQWKKYSEAERTWEPRKYILNNRNMLEECDRVHPF